MDMYNLASWLKLSLVNKQVASTELFVQSTSYYIANYVP